MSFCCDCKKEVVRCWSSDSGCCGGGHCMECGGYNFDDCVADDDEPSTVTPPAIEEVE